MNMFHSNRTRWCLALAATVALLGAVSNANAADDDKDDASNLTPVTTAAQLALQGEARESPALLLAAAEILADLVVSERETDGIESESEGGEGADDAELPDLSMDALIDRARELAEEQGEDMEAAVEAMIDRIEGDARGITYEQGKNYPDEWLNGTQYKLIRSGRINPGETITLTNLMMEGGRLADVRVIGDGDGDIDLWVYDGRTGRQVASDTDLTSYCICNWYPAREQPYTIEFTNVGGIWESYYVIVNW